MLSRLELAPVVADEDVQVRREVERSRHMDRVERPQPRRHERAGPQQNIPAQGQPSPVAAPAYLVTLCAALVAPCSEVRPMITSLTSSGANSPWSTTPGICESHAASAAAFVTSPV